MTPQEIREQIDKNNEAIQKFLEPDLFTLNNVVAALLEENRELQRQCPHNFVDGFCEYCDMEEPK